MQTLTVSQGHRHGRLRMVGTNIGLSTPIQIDAMTEHDELIALDLADILQRLDKATERKRIIESLFIAYRHEYTMSDAERSLFESWVRDRVQGVEAIEAARVVLTEGRA